jgi:hypothetical protein
MAYPNVKPQLSDSTQLQNFPEIFPDFCVLTNRNAVIAIAPGQGADNFAGVADPLREGRRQLFLPRGINDIREFGNSRMPDPAMFAPIPCQSGANRYLRTGLLVLASVWIGRVSVATAGRSWKT